MILPNNIILAVLTTGNWIAIFGIGIPVIIGCIVLIFQAGGVYNMVKEMKPNVAKIPMIEAKVNELWKRKVTDSNSPSVLNEYGKKILSESKIDDIISPYYDEIFKSVQSTQLSNAFQIQQLLIGTVYEYENKTEIKDKLEKAAFYAGTDISTILFVWTIFIRDRVISELGFDSNEIDEHDPESKEKK